MNSAHEELIGRLEKAARLADEIGRESSAHLFAEAAAALRALDRKVAGRDRRIARLLWGMDYARERGVVFPGDLEQVVLSNLPPPPLAGGGDE